MMTWIQGKTLKKWIPEANFITKEGHNMLDVFKEVELNKFKHNFNRLKGNVKKDQGRVSTDLAGYKQDTQVHKLVKDNIREWHGSEAARMLKNDVDNKLHK
eukprot:13480228-Ditylum_brightwellii.AAC.1